MKLSNEIDMSRGALLPKLALFIVPLMLTNVIQLTFHTVDLIVVGRFLGRDALAAVGSNHALILLFVCLLIGLTMGANVLAARSFGAKNDEELRRTIVTSTLTIFLAGLLFALLGIAFSTPLLTLLKVPDEIMPLAGLYLKIWFAGVPFIALYNAAAAILRAVGDTRHPFYFLTISGLLNVGLNLLFVLVFHWGVAGVAIATTLSETLACFLTLRFLTQTDAAYRLVFRGMKIDRKTLRELLYIGIPAALQESLFAISNMTIQGAVNTLGTIVMAGNSAGISIESFVYVAQDAVAQAALSSVSQNVGAREYQRTKRAVLDCTLLEIAVCSLLAFGMILFRRELIGIYTDDPEALAAGELRLMILGSVYFLNGCMNMMPCALRGYGFSLLPTAVTLLGICVFRVIWIATAFAAHPTLTVIYISYPISWAVTALTLYICYFIGRKGAFDRAVLSEKKMGE